MQKKPRNIQGMMNMK